MNCRLFVANRRLEVNSFLLGARRGKCEVSSGGSIRICLYPFQKHCWRRLLDSCAPRLVSQGFWLMSSIAHKVDTFFSSVLLSIFTTHKFSVNDFSPSQPAKSQQHPLVGMYAPKFISIPMSTMSSLLTEEYRSSRIFIKNLPLSRFTDNEFKAHFEKFAPVTDAKLISHRRIGYVGYKTPEDAEKAVKYFNRSFVRMSRIAVEIARPVSSQLSLSLLSAFSNADFY